MIQKKINKLISVLKILDECGTFPRKASNIIEKNSVIFNNKDFGNQPYSFLHKFIKKTYETGILTKNFLIDCNLLWKESLEILKILKIKYKIK